jgi:hypothetical protein
MGNHQRLELDKSGLKLHNQSTVDLHRELDWPSQARGIGTEMQAKSTLEECQSERVQRRHPGGRSKRFGPLGGWAALG